MHLLAYKLNKIPDLTLQKYQILADVGVEGVLKRHYDFLRQWHGVSAITGASIHLLYYCDSAKDKGQRLSVYFFIKTPDEAGLKLVEPLVKKNPLSDFFVLEPCKEIPDTTFAGGATLLKKRRAFQHFNAVTETMDRYSFIPHWEMAENARLYDMIRMLETAGAEGCCAYRIDLTAASEAQEAVKQLTPLIGRIAERPAVNLVSTPSGSMNESFMQMVSKEYEDWIGAVQTTPHFRANVFAFADSAFSAKMILNAAASEAVNEGDFLLGDLRSDPDGAYHPFSRLDSFPNSFNKDEILPNWDTSFLLPEAEPFFRFPTLYDGENIELPKETAPKAVTNGLRMGLDNNEYVVQFPVKKLTKHAFFTGVPGSGKTNTMLQLISEIRKLPFNVPFLVMEPAKKEYREMLPYEDLQDVRLFSPHIRSKFPLRVNPFEFPVGVGLHEHIEALMSIFKGSFIVESPVYKLLSESLQEAYRKKGWFIDEINTGEYEYPTMQDLYDIANRRSEDTAFVGETKASIIGFTQARLGALMERSTGELFNTPVSTLKPDEWLTTPAIVELESLGEAAKNFFILLICNYIYETLRVNPKGGETVPEDPDNPSSKRKPVPVRHVIFIEEAHNIIAPDTQQANESVDPKISATAFIVKMLAEVRALREGIVISDQLPTALAREVSKNTGWKLVHRLTAQDDRALIGSTISASQMQLERMANFNIGRAMMFYEDTQKPFEVQISLWKTPEINYNFAADDELFAHICGRPWMKRSLFAALECWLKGSFEMQEKQANGLFTSIRRNMRKFDDMLKANLHSEESAKKKGALSAEITAEKRELKALHEAISGAILYMPYYLELLKQCGPDADADCRIYQDAIERMKQLANDITAFLNQTV